MLSAILLHAELAIANNQCRLLGAPFKSAFIYIGLLDDPQLDGCSLLDVELSDGRTAIVQLDVCEEESLFFDWDTNKFVDLLFDHVQSVGAFDFQHNLLSILCLHKDLHFITSDDCSPIV